VPPGHDVVLGNSPVVWSQAAVSVDDGRSASGNDLLWLSFSDESSESSVLALPLTLSGLVGENKSWETGVSDGSGSGVKVEDASP